MSRALFVLFFTCVGLVHASREDGVVTEGDLHVSVATRNFKLEASDERASLAQLHERLQAQPAEAQLSAADASQLGMQAAAEALAGMSEIQIQSMKVRKAVMDLGVSEGLVKSASKAAASRDGAKAQLHELAAEQQRVRQAADALDERMQSEHAQMHEASSEAKSVLSTNAEEQTAQIAHMEQQFAQMEKQTAQITQWFEEMAQLNKSRDLLWERKAEAVKEAEAAGLSSEEVQKELSAARAQPNLETAPQESGAAANNAQVEQRKHLADVVASSAVEMAQIEKASVDVMDGLESFAKWKESGDESPESMAHAAQVKAKLDIALKFLEEHENVVDQRTTQINDLMRQANMDPL